MTRLLIPILVGVLLLHLLSWASPLLGPRWSATLRRWRVTIDVAGGLIVLLLIALMLLRGEPRSAVVVAVLGVPVFAGALRALPAWWRGEP